MKKFDEFVEQQQIEWRKNHIANSEWGIQNCQKREWILPHSLWQEGLWEGIRDDKNNLVKYLEDSKVQEHKGVHNLKSSWMLCANLYFPFKQNTNLLAGFLRENISDKINSVVGVELEYAEDYPLDQHTLLAEPADGSRGQGQTSPDIAFIVEAVNGGKGLILTENKFTEHSFYKCSGRDPEYGNPDANRCMDFSLCVNNLRQTCYQLNWEAPKRLNRKYWDYIEFCEEGLNKLKRCPAATAGYQLFRQQALAEALTRSGKYNFVISCVAYDERNTMLIGCLSSTGIDDFRTEWGNLFTGKAHFATFSHQQWVNWVRANDSDGEWKDWLAYIQERYGY